MSAAIYNRQTKRPTVALAAPFEMPSGGRGAIIATLSVGELASELDGGASWVEHLAWSPKGDFLVSAAGPPAETMASA